MFTTIIFAHPWHGSFNKAILGAVTQQLDMLDKVYHVIDLNKEEFNPVMQESDLALYSKGQSADASVLRYQKILSETNELIFIFPIWWDNIPAILKGFFEKVMLKGFAYNETKTGLKGLLTHITKTTVITTSESPTIYINLIKGNPIKGVFIRGMLKDIGLKHVRWYNCDYITSGPRIKKERFLQSIAKNIR